MKAAGRKAHEIDVLIVGGGHNGLVCGSYLARAGLEVQVLERRSVVGGACVTEELFPGFRFSSCSFMLYALHPRDCGRPGTAPIRFPGLSTRPLPVSPLPRRPVSGAAPGLGAQRGGHRRVLPAGRGELSAMEPLLGTVPFHRAPLCAHATSRLPRSGEAGQGDGQPGNLQKSPDHQSRGSGRGVLRVGAGPGRRDSFRRPWRSPFHRQRPARGLPAGRRGTRAANRRHRQGGDGFRHAGYGRLSGGPGRHHSHRVPGPPRPGGGRAGPGCRIDHRGDDPQPAGRLQRRSQADFPGLGRTRTSLAAIPAACPGTPDRDRVFQVPRRHGRAARLLLLAGKGLRSAHHDPCLDLPLHRLRAARVAGSPAGPSFGAARDVDPDSLDLRRQHLPAGQARPVHLCRVCAGPPRPGQLGGTPGGGGRDADRRGDGLRAQLPGSHSGLDAPDATGPGTPRLPDRRQHPPSGHDAESGVLSPAAHRLGGIQDADPGPVLCGAGTHPGGEVSGAPGHNAAHAVLRELGG